MGKIVMVTGGTGYVGSWVVKYLLERGHLVRLTVRDKSTTAKFEHLTAVADTAPGTLELWEADELIMLARRKIFEAIEQVGKGGIPQGVDPETHKVRSASILLDRGEAYKEAAGKALTAVRLAEALEERLAKPVLPLLRVETMLEPGAEMSTSAP